MEIQERWVLMAFVISEIGGVVALPLFLAFLWIFPSSNNALSNHTQRQCASILKHRLFLIYSGSTFILLLICMVWE